MLRTVLSAALTRAMREELVVRNVARLVELPEWRRGTIRPWSAAEARQFLAAAKSDPLYAAFVVLIFYGLRRGEALGLRWKDIDFPAGTIRVRSSSSASGASCSFRRICDDNNVRLIKVHHLRRTVVSLLKDLKVPACDAQTIFGHTRISATLEIYTDTDEEARREALSRLHGLLDQGGN